MKLKSIIALAVMLAASGILYYYTSQTESPTPTKPRPIVWDVNIEELARMEISLPYQSKIEAFVKHEDRYWYFDHPEGDKVNMNRWGGGIPLLLSGPGAERLITDNASIKQLDIFGFLKPSMEISLTLENKKIIKIEVGDRTPDAQGFYVKLRQSKAIYTVHESWVQVLKRLVLEPPYPDPEEKTKLIDPKLQEKQKKDTQLAKLNRVRGDTFRNEYKKGSGVVELESGLIYRVIKKGIGKKPFGNNTVQVNYKGSLIDGTIFDISKKGEPLNFELGKIIRGWQEALKLMKEGAKWELILPPELAYGKLGFAPKIGPNQTLIFEIELLEVKN